MIRITRLLVARHDECLHTPATGGLQPVNRSGSHILDIDQMCALAASQKCTHSGAQGVLQPRPQRLWTKNIGRTKNDYAAARQASPDDFLGAEFGLGV